MIDSYLRSDSLIRIVPLTALYKDDPQTHRSKGRLRKFSFRRQIPDPRHTDIDIRYVIWGLLEERPHPDLVVVLHQSLDQDGLVRPPDSDLVFLHLQQLLEYFLLHLTFPHQLLGRGRH